MKTIKVSRWLFFFTASMFILSCEIENPVELPTLITEEVTEITGNSAKSGGNIYDDGGATIIARGMVWKTSENPTVDNKDGSTSEGIGSGLFISGINGLSPGKTYFVRAYAINNAGTAYGNQVQFKTLELASVTTAEIAEITASSAISGGNVTDDGGAKITSKGVVWSNVDDPTIENNDGMTNEGVGSGEFNSELTELSPVTNYFVRAYATNSEGTSYGNQIAFTTSASAGFLNLTSTVWTSYSLLTDGVDASEGMLADFKGDAIFEADGTGSIGQYTATWEFQNNETRLRIQIQSLPFPIIFDIVTLTQETLEITTLFPNPENPQSVIEIRMIYKKKN